MKTKPAIASLLLVTLGISFTDACAQGSLTPPGAPAPTMKTLDQLEARTPITTATNISQSGSYYLTANIEVATGDAIVISADGVTLDLNGFTLRSTSTAPSGAGIMVSGARCNIAIANGFIAGGVTNDGSGIFSGSGFMNGIYGSDVRSMRVSGVSVTGCQYSGIHLVGDTTIAESCAVRSVGSYGIYAGTVKSSVAEDCGGSAIAGDQVGDCRGESVGGDGISANTVHNSYGWSDRFSGPAVGVSANTVGNSYGYGRSADSSAYGISADIVRNSYGSCYGYGSHAYGISAASVENSLGYASGDSTGAGYGIEAHTAVNCNGFSSRNNAESRGIRTDGPVDTCYAYCSDATALEAESAINCRGESISGIGINASRNAINCIGISDSDDGLLTTTAQNCLGRTSSGSHGLYANTAQNCYGSTYSGTYGLYATIAQNCFGYAYSGYVGLYADYIAIGCHGYNYGSGTGIHGGILNSCSGVGGTDVTSNYKYNTPQ